MSAVQVKQRIPEDRLAEYWFDVQQIAFKKLREVFQGSGLRQEDLVDRLGKDKGQVSRWLRGTDNVTLRTMSNLARAMDCRLSVEFEPLSQLKKSNNQYFDIQRAEAESQPAAAHGTNTFITISASPTFPGSAAP